MKAKTKETANLIGEGLLIVMVALVEIFALARLSEAIKANRGLNDIVVHTGAVLMILYFASRIYFKERDRVRAMIRVRKARQEKEAARTTLEKILQSEKWVEGRWCNIEIITSHLASLYEVQDIVKGLTLTLDIKRISIQGHVSTWRVRELHPHDPDYNVEAVTVIDLNKLVRIAMRTAQETGQDVHVTHEGETVAIIYSQKR